MPAKINLDEKKVIEEYKKGKGSLILSREFNVSKPVILKILRKANVIRKRDRCKKLDIIFDGKVFFLYWKCLMCGKMIKKISKDKGILCRNYYRDIGKVNCKKCSLELQIGKGNPFYGKKHTKETKKKISESRKGKYCGDKNHMKLEQYKKLSSKTLKNYYKNYPEAKKLSSERMKKTIREGKLKTQNKSKKEEEIINYLGDLGINAIQSYRVDTKICDVYIPI